MAHWRGRDSKRLIVDAAAEALQWGEKTSKNSGFHFFIDVKPFFLHVLDNFFIVNDFFFFTIFFCFYAPL